MASATKNISSKTCAENASSHSRHQSGYQSRAGVCCPPMYSNGEEDKLPGTDIEDIIPLESVQLIAKQLLEAEQFFRLTIDLKKLKFVEPLQTRVIEDDDFVHSVSLSYLTAPLFQSSDVFHAIQIARNPKDATELLISDGFCSFRFEDRLLWTDFARLFLPANPENQAANPAASSGAALPIFVRARQSPSEKKSTTIGVATLTFESFLSQEPPSVTDIPQSFYNNLISNNPGVADSGPASNCDTKQCRELPIFEGLMKIPIITRESASIVGLLTLGVAIDLMLNANELSLLLSKSLHRVTPLHPIKSFMAASDHLLTTLPTSKDNTSPPIPTETPSDPLVLTESSCQRPGKQAPASNAITRHSTNSRLPSQAGRASDWRQRLFHRKSQTGGALRERSRSSSKRARGVSAFGSDSAHTSRSNRINPPIMRRRVDSPCSSANEEEDCSGAEEDEPDFLPTAAAVNANGNAPSNLLQMEMLLMKLSAEQAHQKFREEIRMAEKKAEDKVAEVKAENQKLKCENQSLESKLADLEKKFHGLQKSIESAKSDSPHRRKGDPYKLGSDRSTSREPNIDTIDELRRQNERLLQLLLRQSSQNHQPLWPAAPTCPNLSPADFQQMMASLSPPRTRTGGETETRACPAPSAADVSSTAAFVASQLAQASNGSSTGDCPPPLYASRHHSTADTLPLPPLPYTVSAPPLCVAARPRDPFDCRPNSSSWATPNGDGSRVARRLPPVPSTRQGRLPTRHNRNRSDAKGVRSSSTACLHCRPPSPPLDCDDRRPSTLHAVSSATCGASPPQKQTPCSTSKQTLENRRSAGPAFQRNASDNPPPDKGGKRLRSDSSSSSSVSSSPLTSRSKQLLAELLKKGESS